VDPASAMDDAGRLTVLVRGAGHGSSLNSLYRWSQPSVDLLPLGWCAPEGARIDGIDATSGDWIALAMYAWTNVTLPQGRYVMFFNGTRWGAPQLIDGSSAGGGQDMQVRFDYRGETVVAYDVYNGVDYGVYVSRSSGSSWGRLGNALLNYPASMPANWVLAIDTLGRPVMSWVSEAVSYSVVWNGSAWSALPNAVSYLAGGADYRSFHTSSGNTFGTSIDLSKQPPPLRIYLDGGMFAQFIGSPCSACNGDGWTEDQQGNPIVVWLEGQVFCAKKWNGTVWTTLESDAPCSGVATGTPIVSPGGAHALFVSACYVNGAYTQHTTCGRYNR
jgi:hypothetical protein